MLGQHIMLCTKVFPNEATAFHPWLPQRSRRARLCAWAARKLPSGAAWRMQMAGVAWNSRTQWTFALRPGRGCNPVDIALPVQPFERMSNRGQICLSMSSCSECDGPDRVLPGLIQLPARDGAYKSRCSVLDVMEASTRLINAVPPDVVLAAYRALRIFSIHDPARSTAAAARPRTVLVRPSHVLGHLAKRTASKRALRCV